MLQSDTHRFRTIFLRLVNREAGNRVGPRLTHENGARTVAMHHIPATFLQSTVVEERERRCR